MNYIIKSTCYFQEYKSWERTILDKNRGLQILLVDWRRFVVMMNGIISLTTPAVALVCWITNIVSFVIELWPFVNAFWKFAKVVTPNGASVQINPLSATWRIYPSSKWSSQWPYDGYIRHGWMTSCGLGRDSATVWNVLGEAIEGRFSFEARNYLFSFRSYVRFEEFFFCFPRFERFGAKCSSSGAFWFRRCFGALLKTPLRHRAFFCELLLRPQVFLENVLSFFPKQSRFYLPDSYGDPKSEQSTLVMVRRKPVWKLDFRALARLSAEGPSIVVAIGTSRVRWSMVQKRKKKTHTRKSACDCAKAQPFIIYKPASFEEPVSETRRRYRFALRWFRGRGCTAAGRQAAARGQQRKAAIRDIPGVDHWGETNLSAPIWFTGQRHCTVFRHVMQLSLLVLCWKSTLTVTLPQIKKKKSLSNVGHRGTKAENLAWHSTG